MPHLFIRDLPRYECLQEASLRYPSLDPSACEAYLHLLRTSDAVSEAGMEHLGRHQISEGRFNILMLLNREPGEPSSPAVLAEMTGVSRASMSGVLDTLERDGLVTRTSDPEDRRGILVLLTPAGRALIDEVCPGYFTRVAEIIQPLDPAERKQLVALLKKIQQGVAKSLSPETALSNSN